MDDIQKWFLEHGGEERADASLRDLVSDLGSDDYALSSEGFRSFRSRVQKERRHGRARLAERIAAALLLPVVALSLFLALRRPAPMEWAEVYTRAGETRLVELPDGSTLRLSPLSRLVFPESFKGKVRKVFLEGEAYADIRHNAKKPLEIHSGDILVTVYGTEFNFSSYQNDAESELALVDGSVRMQISGPGSGHTIEMRPGEMVRYSRSTGSLERQRFSSGTYRDNERREGLQFTNRRLDDIVRCLERRFNVRIVIEDKIIAEERFYASFINGEDLQTILSSLNTQNYMDIHQKGDLIVLSLK